MQAYHGVLILLKNWIRVSDCQIRIIFLMKCKNIVKNRIRRKTNKNSYNSFYVNTAMKK